MYDASGGPGPAARRATVLVAVRTNERAAIVDELLEAGYAILEAQSAEDLEALSTAGEPFAVAVVDVTVASRAMIDAVRQVRINRTPFATLFVTDPQSFELVDGAGLGPDDELAMSPLTPDALRWRVEAMLIRSSVDETSGQADPALAGQALQQLNAGSPILAVFNPKGGVGKTTVATNLATMLQMRKDRRVLLVDADTVTGHVALSLGFKAVRGVADTWGAELEGDDRELLLNLASEHSSGIRVATLAADPFVLQYLNADRVADAILEARSGVDTIVVDLHPSYSDINLAIFATATRILVPVTPDLPSIRAAVQLTRIAVDLGVRDRLSLVVNRANSGVSAREIEKATGMTAIAEIRSAGMLLVRAGNIGMTLVQQFPREQVTQDFDHLADRVLALVGAGAATRAHAPERSRTLGAILGTKVPASS